MAGTPADLRPWQSKRSLLRPASLVAVLAALTACSDPLSVAVSGASLVSVVQTGKTLSDHAMSAATGMDCSIRHTFAGTSWCQPTDAVGAPSVEHYCYRSIAEVTCYRRDNPHETASRRTF